LVVGSNPTGRAIFRLYCLISISSHPGAVAHFLEEDFTGFIFQKNYTQSHDSAFLCQPYFLRRLIMIKKHFKTYFSLFSLLPLILTTFIMASTASSGSLFGPKKYKRTSGPPNKYTDTFKATGGNGRLIIINGDADGDNRITNAVIYLNGKEIFCHNDFKKKVSLLEKSVHLNNGFNTVKLELHGKPGSYITLKVTGIAIPPPNVDINASPESIRIGASSTLTWCSTNANTCFIDQGVGSVPLNGKKTVTPKQNTTYTITATGPGGTSKKSVTLSVIRPPSVTITANPKSIFLGASSTLTWSSTNATSCFINQGVGRVPTGGSVDVKPLQTTIYRITATGIGGTHTANVTVNVSSPSNPPFVSISAIPNEIIPGGFAHLSWSSSGGQSAFIDNGVGAVALSGTATVNPVNTTVYTISVTGPGGSTGAEAIVTVKGNPAPPRAGSFGEQYGALIPKDATIPAYDAKRFSVVTGLVQNISGAPLAGVTVFFHGRPVYGTAKTGDNGRFSIPVEGGTTMTLTYKKQGSITVQRQVNVPWNGYAVAETVKMISEDPVSTTFSFDGNPTTVKTHRSTMHTDGFGSRSTTLVFTGDNQAYLTDKDGNTVQTLRTITTRATEFTIPDSMPAILPPNSAYTFCTELTVDGASRVRFQKPVVMWVENFLGFPVGSAVPVGYYDRDRGVWVPSTNGKVVELLDTNGDGIVDAIDATGSGLPADLNNNGSFADEAVGLNDRSKYAPGSTYWRVEVAHFSPWDCNWPFGPPPDATPPNPESGPDTDSNPVDKDDPCKTSSGSYAEDRSRTVHEDIPVPGTDITLHYSSKRAKGYKYTFSVPASGSTVPISLKNIHVRAEVTGRIFEQVLPPQPNQKAEFSWDGLDIWGMRVIGSVNANINIGFEYGAVYYGADSSANARAFARAGVDRTTINSRQNLFSWISHKMNISLPPAADMSWSHIAEGWTISSHHYLNPSNPTPLFRGDGSTNSNNVYIITTVAGDGSSGWGDLGDGGSALLAKLRGPMDIAVDAEDNLYILDSGHFVIRKVDTTGIITTVAGRPGAWGFSGDGGPAVDALLHLGYGGLSVDTAGNIYFSDNINRRIRKVDSNGIIATVAGNGNRGYSGDGGPAVDAMLGDVEDIAFDNVGNLYIHDRESNCIRKVDTNGIITTVAGNGPSGDRWCDNCPALTTHLRVSNNIAMDAKGNLYIGNTSLNLIRKVDNAGMISTVAGMGYGYEGDTVNDGPALATPITPVALAADSLGNIFFFNYQTHTLHKLDMNGTITKMAGNGTPGYTGDGGAAINAQLYHGSIAVNARGDIYIVDSSYYNVVRKIFLALSRIDAGGDVHFTDDNGLTHVFSSTGSHKTSIDLNTGVVLKAFGYNSSNQLISITDQFGRQTLINRDGNGTATSITSPEGITTTLSIDGKRRLKNIIYPAGETYRFDYTSDGLLTAKTEPEGNRFTHSFDGNGRLMVVSDEEGGNWQFHRTANGNGNILSTVTTGEGNVTHYRDQTSATGAVNSIITDSTGAETTYFRSSDGIVVNKSLSCGMSVSFKYDLDPQYKFKAVKEMTHSTPSTLQQSTTFSKIYADINSDGFADRITETITQNSKATIFEQDTLLAKKTMVSPAGRILTSFYNPANLLTTKLTIPNLHDTNYSYDDKGRLTTLNRDTRKTTFNYNSQGFLASITDPENKTISYGYDATGRVTQINRPDGATIGFGYDANGNTTVIRTPSAINHGFGYSKVNLNSSYTAPLSGVYRYIYNKDRQLRQVTFPSRRQLTNIYKNGNVAQLQTAEGDINYTYLCGSKVGSMTRGSEKITYAYDGKLLTSSTLSGTLNEALAYGYNNDFMPTRFTYAGGITHYAYDNDGLITGAGAFTITRDAQNGLPQSVSNASLTLNRKFNGYGEQTAETYNITGRNVAAWDLTFTDAGQIKSKTEIVDGITASYIYTYDLAGKLTSVTRSDGVIVEQYRYGSNGARISENNVLRGITRNLTYSTEDHLITAGNTTYLYDVDGFLKERDQNGALTAYHYSSRGELLKVTLPNGTFIEYIHDPLGRRIAAKVNGVITEKYLWEGQTRLLAIYDGSDNLMMRFDYADGRMPYSMTSGGNTYYLTYDQVGSLRVITDRSGKTLKRIDYDSFGNIIADTNPQLNVMFGFAGGLHDPDTGLVRFGYRDYNPDTGRWTAKDPIFFAGGDTDLYGYVTNDPINYTDSFGLETYRCRKPLDALGGRGERSGPDVPGNPLFHQYLCVERKGVITCGGQGSQGDRLYGPGAPSNDIFLPSNCEIISYNQCVENCLLRRFNSQRPYYGLVGPGTNCQEWSDDQFRNCLDICS
jgi:RHS repeat-associated protein